MPSLTWMLLTNVLTLKWTLTSNRFLLGIVRAWDAIKILLYKQIPYTWDDWMNQPLLANSLVRDSIGNVLGLRTRLAWGKLHNVSVASMRSSIQVQLMPKVDRLKQLHSVYGVKTMTMEI